MPLDLDLPLPGRRLDELRAAIERQLGRPLVLIAAPLRRGNSALLVRTEPADVLLMNQAASPMDQLLAAAHQLAYLFYSHRGIPDHHSAKAAFPHLDPHHVSAMLPIHRYTPDDEREADAFAAQFVIEAMRPGDE
jgi:hypothetical protein